jgi:predicted Zn-ribbon and HTH transcriptional regulator
MNSCKKWWGYRHNWNKWTVVEKHNLLRSSDKALIGEVIVQKQKCQDCGFERYDQQNINV